MTLCAAGTFGAESELLFARRGRSPELIPSYLQLDPAPAPLAPRLTSTLLPAAPLRLSAGELSPGSQGSFAELFCLLQTCPVILTLDLPYSEFRTKLYKGKCYGNCPAKTFTATTAKTCTDCPANALTCTSTEVLTCESGYFVSGNTCGSTSQAYYRIPGVATSAASTFDFSSTEAKTERQCVDFCATHTGEYIDIPASPTFA